MQSVAFGILSLILLGFHNDDPGSRVATGADRLAGSSLQLLKGKRVGLVTNHTGRLRDGTMLLDSLLARRINIVTLFGPEHGIRGDAGAGEHVDDTRDLKTGIKVYSLYGERTKPTREMLRGLDILVYDIQDVGARFYTYISTMKLTMEAAAESGIPFVVLDRPNPLGGLQVDGPIIEDSLRSFVGIVPIPVIYGLTCGELAQMINGEGWLAHGVRADLRVVVMEGWTPNMILGETNLPWVIPSPNIRTPDAALVYPGICLLEGTNISEGRGTSAPFLTVGAPFVESDKLWAAMTGLNLKGVRFSPIEFTPASSKFAGELCHGIRIEVTDRKTIEPMLVGLGLVSELAKLNPGDVTFQVKRFNQRIGRGWVLEQLRQGVEVESIRRQWRSDEEHFRQISSKYLLYPRP